MKVLVDVIDVLQVEPDIWQHYVKTYVFDSLVTIDEIVASTGVKDISTLKISLVEEAQR